MLKKSRLVAVFIVLLMLISVFTMLIAPSEGAAVSDEDMADEEYGELTNEYGWLDGVEIAGEYSDMDGMPELDVFVGQREVEMRPYFNENVTEDNNDEANITHSEVLVDDIVRLTGDDWKSDDEDDWVSGTDTFEWEADTDTIYDDTGGFSGITDFAGNFVFSVSTEATPGIYRIPIDMRIKNYSDANDEWYGPHENLEYVWLEVAGNAEVDDITLDPGMEFENQQVRVWNQGNSNMEDVYLTLEEDDLVDNEGNQVTIHNPTSYVNQISNTSPGWRDFNFRFSVPSEMEPGEYEMNYTITANLMEDEEVEITEHGTITVTITPQAELSAEIVDNEVEQGTPMQEFTVNFTNTGNLDLERISVEPEDIFPFSVPSEYYVHSTATSDDPMIDIGDLDVDESTDVDMILGLDQYIQIGQHKLFFDYEAYYYDHEGKVTGEEQYVEVHDGNLVADTDEPFAWIEVTEPDVAMDVYGYIQQTLSVNDMGYQVISVNVVNRGYVDYTNANIELNIDGTPFINPEDEGEDTVEMLDESFTLNTESQREVHFGVIIDTSFIEQRLEDDNPVYTAEFTMEAINGDTLEEEELQFNAEGLVTGVGPKLVITGDTEVNNVEAGEEFTLNYTIENRGDEPVRGLMVRASPHSSGAEEVNVESFESAQDAIYFWQAGSPPGSQVWDVEPEDTVLHPGESTTVTFHMVSSGDMQDGAVYHVDLEVMGSTEENWETTATIRTQESDSTKPILSTQLTYVLVALILGVFFALGLFLYKREKKPKAEEEPEESETETEEYAYEEPESDEIEPEPSTDWKEEPEEPPAPEDEIFEEDESQIEPSEREEW